jgi:hypothetical protein
MLRALPLHRSSRRTRLKESKARLQHCRSNQNLRKQIFWPAQLTLKQTSKKPKLTFKELRIRTAKTQTSWELADIPTLVLTALCLKNNIHHYFPLKSHPSRLIGLFLLLRLHVTIQILKKVSFWIQTLTNSKPTKISESAEAKATSMILR